MDAIGVSPVIATVLLIVVTVVLVGVVAMVAMGMVGGITPPKNTSLLLENVAIGSQGFIVRHNGGDPIPFKDLEVRVNGRLATYERENENMQSFVVGDYIEVRLQQELKFMDYIVVIYKPANQIIVSTRVA
ncbi:MAG: type IV pilin [Candidatus Hadarchaeales archaeon]